MEEKTMTRKELLEAIEKELGRGLTLPELMNFIKNTSDLTTTFTVDRSTGSVSSMKVYRHGKEIKQESSD